MCWHSTDGNYDLIVDDLNKSIDTNVNGILKTIYAFLPLIKKGEQKKVVAISSGTADLGMKTPSTPDIFIFYITNQSRQTQLTRSKSPSLPRIPSARQH